MSKRSADVDRYIAKAAPFAQPILEKIREAFHAAHPDIVETMKWSAPHFEYKGVIAGMAAFKEHVRWGFWKAKLMKDPEGILDESMGNTAMGAAKLAGVRDLPSKKVLVGYVREAVRLNEEGVKAPRPARSKTPATIDVPDDLMSELKKNKKARATFDAFSPSQRREYVDWITEAKQEATRRKRLATAIEWLSEGKSRNWKYMK